MNEETMLEVTELINRVGVSWKIKRNLLKYKYELSEETIEQLLPKDKEYEHY